MNKKGELTSAQIIGLVLAIAGFLVLLLFLLYVSGIKNMTEEEICTLSVLTRATVPESAQQTVPLKCTTKKICLSLSGEKCPLFFGEKNVENVRLPSNAEAASRKIAEISANAMFDCWRMMGKGNLDIFGPEGNFFANYVQTSFTPASTQPKCIICSRVALAPELQLAENKEIIENVNLADYLENTQVPSSSLTYLETFTDRQVTNYPQEFRNDFANNQNQKETNEISFIFMQILVNKDDSLKQAIERGETTGLVLGSGALLTSTGRKITAATPVGVGLAVGAVSLFSGAMTYFRAENNKAMAATSCGKLTSTKTEQYGCSIVAPIDYSNLKKINEVCKGGIEGNP